MRTGNTFPNSLTLNHGGHLYHTQQRYSDRRVGYKAQPYSNRSSTTLVRGYLMKTGLSQFNLSRHAFIVFLGAMLFFIAAEPALASNTTGGGLPFDDWMTNIRTSITGPFAYTASIVGLVGAGAMLIFGGDMNGFLRTLIFIVLVLSFLVAAQNTLSAITGQGAELTAMLASAKTGGVA